jgi:hypothetical protein
MEMEGRTGVVARWNYLHGRDLQERREDDLRQRDGGAAFSAAPPQIYFCVYSRVITMEPLPPLVAAAPALDAAE